MGEDQPSLRHFIPAFALLLFSAVAAFAVTLGSPEARQQMAVIAPPWYSTGQTIALVAAAGGRVVETGQFANILVAYSDDSHFSSALYGAGAWLVVDPVQLRGCLGFSAARASQEGRV